MLYTGRFYDDDEMIMCRACWSNNVEVVKELVQEKYPMNEGNLAGITPCSYIMFFH